MQLFPSGGGTVCPEQTQSPWRGAARGWLPAAPASRVAVATAQPCGPAAECSRGCSAPATSTLSNFPCAQSAAGSGAGRSSGRAAMQASPRRRSAVSIFSHFFQGRRHSSSDPLLRLSQRRRSSVVELLSSSTQRVMVALSSLSPEELDATFLDKKSKVLFIETGGSSVYFLGITILLFC